MVCFGYPFSWWYAVSSSPRFFNCSLLCKTTWRGPSKIGMLCVVGLQSIGVISSYGSHLQFLVAAVITACEGSTSVVNEGRYSSWIIITHSLESSVTSGVVARLIVRALVSFRHVGLLLLSNSRVYWRLQLPIRFERSFRRVSILVYRRHLWKGRSIYTKLST